MMKKKSVTKKVEKTRIYPVEETDAEEQFYLFPYRGKPAKPFKALRALASKDSRFAWEFHKKYSPSQSSGDQYIRFWSETGLDRVQDVLLTNFKESDITGNAEELMEAEDHMIGAALHLVKHDYYPIRIRENPNRMPEEEKERLAEVIMASLRDAVGEYVFQILFKPSPYSIEDYTLRDAVGLGGPRKIMKRNREREDSIKSQELATDIEDKMSGTTFKVQIRVLGSCASEEELKKGVESLSASLSQFGYRNNRGNRARLKIIDPEELDDFVHAVRTRQFYNSAKLYQKIIPFVSKDPHPRYLCARELRWFMEIPIHSLQDYQLHTATMKSHLSSAEQSKRHRLGKTEGDVEIGTDERGKPVSVHNWENHVYISGKTGVGKSTVMQNMALSKVEDGENVIVLDPHGDLAHGILERIDPSRYEDVIYISPLSPIGFNALSIPDFPAGEEEKLSKMGRRRLREARMGADEKQSRALAEMTKDHFGAEFWGPRLESIFEWFTKGLLNEKGSNFVDFYHILNDKDTARKFAQDTSIEELENYVHTFFDQLDDRDKHSTLNKIGKIRRSRVLRKMLCIREPDIDVSDLIQGGKIVLVNLSKGLHDKDKAHFVGSALSNLIWSCIGHRQLLNEEDRGETYLFADEFQNFATDVFEDMLSEGRKFGLRLCLANQYTHQLSEEVWRGIAGNVGTFVTFAGSNEDAERLSMNFGDKVEQHEFVNLEKYNALVKYPKADVIRVQTDPPPGIKNGEAVGQAIQRMEKLSPNVNMKLQRANTPRWQNEEADTWDILTGIYRKQIESGGPPLISDVKEVEPRNNLQARLETLAADGTVLFNPDGGEPKTVGLNRRSIEELCRLIGTSNKAGGEEHKELIVKLWEFLQVNGFEAHIIRQHEKGVVPDLTIENSNHPNFEWGGRDIEVEKSTKETPTKVLKNLAMGENKDRKIFFVAEDAKGAEQIHNIVSDPFAATGKKYKKPDGTKFMPEKEFTSNYWDDGCPVDLNDLCKILIFEDGMLKEYHRKAAPTILLSYDEVVNGGDYLYDSVEGLEQDTLPEKDEDESNEDGSEEEIPVGKCPECEKIIPITTEECPGCGQELAPPEEYEDLIDDEGQEEQTEDDEESTEDEGETREEGKDEHEFEGESQFDTPADELVLKHDASGVALVDGDENEYPWVAEDEDGDLKVGETLSEMLEEFDKGKSKDSLQEDHLDLVVDISEKEHICSQVSSKTLQPNKMRLSLDNLPQAQRYTAIITEAIISYAKYPSNGYRVPMSPTKLGELLDSLEGEKGNAELPDRDGNFNRKMSEFLQQLGVDTSQATDNRQKEYHISNKIELLTDMYRFMILDLVGEGIYTYPLIYKESLQMVGRYTVHRLFDHIEISKDSDKVKLYFLRRNGNYDVLEAITTIKEADICLEKICEHTGLEENEVKLILEDWDIDPEYEEEILDLKQRITRTLKPFVKE